MDLFKWLSKPRRPCPIVERDGNVARIIDESTGSKLGVVMFDTLFGCYVGHSFTDHGFAMQAVEDVASYLNSTENQPYSLEDLLNDRND